MKLLVTTAIASVTIAVPVLQYGTVLRVTDGDTVHVVVQRANEDIHVLGIDTPEVPHYGKPGTCYGEKAKEFVTTYLAKGAHVVIRIEPSTGDVTDRYGRTIAYVYSSAHRSDLGAALLRRGLANVYPYGNRHFAKRASYERLRDAAKAAKRGLWGACPATEWPR